MRIALKKGRCSYCGRLVRLHTPTDARVHLVMSHAQVAIQRRAKEHVTNDLRLLGKRFKRYLSKEQRKQLTKGLRYPI